MAGIHTAARRSLAEWPGHTTLSNSVSPCPWMQSKGSHVGFQIPCLLSLDMVGWLQQYLITVGNLSRGALQMVDDLMNMYGGYYHTFLEILRNFIFFSQDSRWETGW